MRRTAAVEILEERQRLEEKLRLICSSIPDHLPAIRSDDEERVILDFVYKDVRCVFIRTQVQPGQGLSPREQEIVRLVAAGHPNKVIAAILDISYWTVGTHLRRIFAKFGVTSRAAMVARFQADRVQHLNAEEYPPSPKVGPMTSATIAHPGKVESLR
jgi:DNA-binding CsgD family transcriptional regulator